LLTLWNIRPYSNVQLRPQLVAFVVSVLAAASMWFYVDQVLVVYQRADAAAHQRPRGNLSDLYPRWLGARELLLHHRNPYGDDITREIQKGYYGRALDPTRPNDPKDQNGFAYPVYVVFLLSPVIAIPFPLLMVAFYWFLAVLTAASVWLWLRALRWRLPHMDVATCILLMVGSFSAAQGIKLQQLSLLVAALLAASVAATASGSLFIGGALLALATIKPQLAWPLVAWLLVWAVSDWRARRKLVFGFASVMTLMLAGAEAILPGWWRMFACAVAQYWQYTESQSVIEVMLDQLWPVAGGIVGRLGGRILAAAAVLACTAVFWRLRREPADTPRFSSGTALVLALTVLVVPRYSPYNQILLLPAILLLVRERVAFSSRSRVRRLAYSLGVLMVGWQWAASLCLTVAYLIGSRMLALKGWQWPFYATFALPVWVFALVFFYAQSESRQSVQPPLREN
jgi:hypothetical protein